MIAALEQIKSRVLDRYPYFGSVVAGLCFKESFYVDAFGTDGEAFYFNPNSCDCFSDEDLAFLFAHELCHIAFNHIERSRDKNQRLWSIASDAVTNALLIKDGFKPAPNAVIVPEALDQDAEQFYLGLLEKELSDNCDTKKRPQENEAASDSSSQCSSDSETDADDQSSASDSKNSKDSERSTNGKDDSKKDDLSGDTKQKDTDELRTEDVGNNAHSLWDKNIAKKSDDEDTQQPEDANENEDEEDSVMDEQRVYKENKVKTKTKLAEIQADLSNQASGAGTSTNSDIREMNGIGESKPLMDWRRALKDEVCFDVDWSYKNAVIENGVVTPHLEEVQHPVTEILLDTSGSIEESLLKSFLRECKGILQSSQIKVGCFDIMFYGFKEIRTEKDIDEMDYKGGGGTNFNAAVNAFSRRVTNKIIFTDGDAEMPDVPMDSIWIVFGPEEISPIGGRVIRISPEQLNDMTARSETTSEF